MRTERVNPHVLSVRINEGVTVEGQDRKHLAYLLDRQTIAVVDLVTGNFFNAIDYRHFHTTSLHLSPACTTITTIIVSTTTVTMTTSHHYSGDLLQQLLSSRPRFTTITTITTTLTTTSSSQVTTTHQMSLPLVMCELFRCVPKSL